MEMPKSLSPDEIKFYDRQIKLAQCGLEGQLRLKQSKVAVIGAGGLGSSALNALALTGVGHLVIFDFDRVSLSNLHRQVLYRHSDLGKIKVQVAKERLLELNPWLEITLYERALRRYADLELLQDVDLILDCTDRFAARANIAAICKDLQVPHAYASVSSTDGQVALFYPQGACFRCVFRDLPTGGVIQSCDQGGVMGVSPMMIGAMQAQIAIDYLLLKRPKDTAQAKLSLISTQDLRVYDLDLAQSSFCSLCNPQKVSQEQETKQNKVTQYLEPFPIPMSTEEACFRIKNGWNPVIVDVRDTTERNQGYIENSIHREVTKLLKILEGFDAKSLQKADPELYQLLAARDTLVYCARGPRAEKAARALHKVRQNQVFHQSLGISIKNKNETYELVGGYSRWSEQVK